MKLTISTQNYFTFLGSHLISITYGLFYILPLIIPFNQFIICQTIILIISSLDIFIFRRSQILLLYLFGFALSYTLLQWENYTKTCLIAIFLGSILNIKQQLQKYKQLEFHEDFIYIGILIYYTILKFLTQEYMSLITFIIFTLAHLLFNDTKFQVNLTIPRQLEQEPQNIYKVILLQLITYIIFYCSLFQLYQLSQKIVIISLTLKISISLFTRYMYTITQFISKFIVILEIILIITWILEDIFIIIPFQYRIILLFLSTPFNQVFIQDESYELGFKQKLSLELIANVFAGMLIFMIL